MKKLLNLLVGAIIMTVGVPMSVFATGEGEYIANTYKFQFMVTEAKVSGEPSGWYMKLVMYDADILAGSPRGIMGVRAYEDGRRVLGGRFSAKYELFGLRNPGEVRFAEGREFVMDASNSDLGTSDLKGDWMDVRVTSFAGNNYYVMMDLHGCAEDGVICRISGFKTGTASYSAHVEEKVDEGGSGDAGVELKDGDDSEVTDGEGALRVADDDGGDGGAEVGGETEVEGGDGGDDGTADGGMGGSEEVVVSSSDEGTDGDEVVGEVESVVIDRGAGIVARAVANVEGEVLAVEDDDEALEDEGNAEITEDTEVPPSGEGKATTGGQLAWLYWLLAAVIATWVIVLALRRRQKDENEKAVAKIVAKTKK